MRIEIMNLKKSKTMKELKDTYRQLVFIFHPDRGGLTSDMQDLNSVYAEYFKILKDSMDKETPEYRSVKNETPSDLMDIISKIVHLDGLEIEIVGSWVWVSSDEKSWEYRDYLKEIGFKWSKGRKKLYYTKDVEKVGFYKKKTFDELRATYGNTKIESERVQRVG